MNRKNEPSGWLQCLELLEPLLELGGLLLRCLKAVAHALAIIFEIFS
jgi:hypothetical protein